MSYLLLGKQPHYVSTLKKNQSYVLVVQEVAVQFNLNI